MLDAMPVAMPGALPHVMHATQRNATHSRFQDLGGNPRVSDARLPVEIEVFTMLIAFSGAVVLRMDQAKEEQS